MGRFPPIQFVGFLVQNPNNVTCPLFVSNPFLYNPHSRLFLDLQTDDPGLLEVLSKVPYPIIDV